MLWAIIFAFGQYDSPASLVINYFGKYLVGGIAAMALSIDVCQFQPAMQEVELHRIHHIAWLTIQYMSPL